MKKTASKKLINLHISIVDLTVAWIGVILLILSNLIGIGYTKFYLIGTFLVLFGLISAVNRKASFLKPDKKRILITVILSIILFTYSFVSMVMFCSLSRSTTEKPCDSYYSLPWEGPCPRIYCGRPDSLTSIMIAVYPLINFIGEIMSFIITPYFLSCLIFWVYDKIKKMKGKNKFYCILGIIVLFVIIALFINSLSSICTYTQAWEKVSDNKTECTYYQETFSISKDRIKWENEACWEYFDVTSCKESEFSNSFNTWRNSLNSWLSWHN
jgi:hypothetical protein